MASDKKPSAMESNANRNNNNNNNRISNTPVAMSMLQRAESVMSASTFAVDEVTDYAEGELSDEMKEDPFADHRSSLPQSLNSSSSQTETAAAPAPQSASAYNALKLRNSTCKIIGTQLSLNKKQKPYTIYIIEITYDGGVVQVTRRYSELYKLHSKLSRHYKHLPKFPPKKMFGNLDKAFVKQRKALLAEYLSKVFTREDVLAYEKFQKFFLEDDVKTPDFMPLPPLVPIRRDSRVSSASPEASYLKQLHQLRDQIAAHDENPGGGGGGEAGAAATATTTATSGESPEKVDAAGEAEAQKLETPVEKRIKILIDILDSEIAYVNKLKFVRSKFINPLLESKILSHSAVNKIFKNIETVRAANESFLTELIQQYTKAGYPAPKVSQDLISPSPLSKVQMQEETEPQEQQHQQQQQQLPSSIDWSSIQVGQIFLKRIHGFKMYISYVEQYFVLRDTLASLHENQAFAAFLAETESKQHTSLHGMLLLPYQRLHVYTGSLKTLIKYTDPEHPDYHALTQSLAQMEAINSSCEDYWKDRETALRVVMIAKEHRMKHLITPTRRIVNESTIIKKVKLNEKGSVPCKLYLFNDLLLCVKSTNGKMRRIEMPLISELKIEIYPITDGFPNSFAVKSTQYKFEFECPNKETQESWMALVSKTLQANISSSSSSSASSSSASATLASSTSSSSSAAAAAKKLFRK